MFLSKIRYCRLSEEKRTEIWVKLMIVGAKSGCHQMPERSFFIHGCQLPVCARCTGVFIGYLLALIVLPFYLLSVKSCILFCGIMFADWFVQFLKIRESTNVRRLITGILGGYGLFSLYINIILYIVKLIVM
ncbi:MAG: DUF2085 domain-containing protein [Oscillospiraceae bacterium]